MHCASRIRIRIPARSLHDPPSACGTHVTRLSWASSASPEKRQNGVISCRPPTHIGNTPFRVRSDDCRLDAAPRSSSPNLTQQSLFSPIPPYANGVRAEYANASAATGGTGRPSGRPRCEPPPPVKRPSYPNLTVVTTLRRTYACESNGTAKFPRYSQERRRRRRKNGVSQPSTLPDDRVVSQPVAQCLRQQPSSTYSGPIPSVALSPSSSSHPGQHQPLLRTLPSAVSVQPLLSEAVRAQY